MAHRLPNLNLLRAFEAAARHRSFTTAAEELCLTPAAISQQVRALENNLGFLLFERLPRGVALTHMGAAYLPPIRQAFDDISASTAGLFGLRGESSVKLRAPMSFSVLNLVPRLARFNEEYPDIEVRLGSSLWADEVEAESYDIDIRFGDGNWSGYHADLLVMEDFVPVCSPDLDPFPEDLAEMAAGKLISVMGSEGAWLSAKDVADIDEVNPRRVLRADTYLVAAELAVSGAGALMLPRSMALPFIESERLVMPLDIKLPMKGSHYLLRKEDHRRTKPEVTILQQWLLNDYQQDQANTEELE
ncbi:LysR substrate-binding domain-containing protein [Leucothrix pacifica]|uniref:LysR family transcriptional regulator n=1 Tax=Leucothrix pacifica TaxID=1247513 RepID=A0A317C3W9_9GAMM|nr:LysR substrate-binding domain-containing protein [Leucothrix pacifica]PWQ92063.1 LysR family transcriptional regulator [Leucothrix pacifica]